MASVSRVNIRCEVMANGRFAVKEQQDKSYFTSLFGSLFPFTVRTSTHARNGFRPTGPGTAGSLRCHG